MPGGQEEQEGKERVSQGRIKDSGGQREANRA